MYRVCRIFHYTPDEVDEMPGYLIDWFLAFHDLEQEVADREAQKAGKE